MAVWECGEFMKLLKEAEAGAEAYDKMEQHHEETNPAVEKATWTCDECPKTFQTKSGLVRHRRKHTGAYPYPCVECPKGFHSKVMLDDHKRIRHGARRSLCPCCNKSVCSYQGRKHHSNLHSDEIFECDHCDKKFNTRLYLQRHILTHSVTHSCDICFKKYSTKAHLKDHMRTHNSVFLSVPRMTVPSKQ
ncbi:unnamed protein product, partial [Owenia fusiformis]